MSNYNNQNINMWVEIGVQQEKTRVQRIHDEWIAIRTPHLFDSLFIQEMAIRGWTKDDNDLWTKGNIVLQIFSDKSFDFVGNDIHINAGQHNFCLQNVSINHFKKPSSLIVIDGILALHDQFSTLRWNCHENGDIVCGNFVIFNINDCIITSEVEDE